MQKVVEYIDSRAATFAKEPVFAYLRDASIDPHERLRFVPCTAHFIMTFADLGLFFLREEPPRDRYDELANANLIEEADHWKWFLADLTSLGLDPTLRFTDAVRFIWSDATVETRRLGYQICKLSAGLDSLHKLVLVLAIEATAKVALEASVPAGREIAERTGKKLVYFGSHHLDSELGHTLATDDVHRAILDVVLDSDSRASLLSLVDQIFDQFWRFMDGAFAFAKNGTNLGR